MKSVGAPTVAKTVTRQLNGADGELSNAEVGATGLYALLGNKAIPEDLNGGAAPNRVNGYKYPIEAAGLIAAIGAPAEPKLYHTVSSTVVVNENSGADATGLYARIGGPDVAAVIANVAGTLANGDKAAIPVSGLWEKIGSPAVAAVAVGGNDGTNPLAA